MKIYKIAGSQIAPIESLRDLDNLVARMVSGTVQKVIGMNAIRDFKNKIKQKLERVMHYKEKLDREHEASRKRVEMWRAVQEQMREQYKTNPNMFAMPDAGISDEERREIQFKNRYRKMKHNLGNSKQEII